MKYELAILEDSTAPTDAGLLTIGESVAINFSNRAVIRLRSSFRCTIISVTCSSRNSALKPSGNSPDGLAYGVRPCEANKAFGSANVHHPTLPERPTHLRKPDQPARKYRANITRILSMAAEVFIASEKRRFLHPSATRLKTDYGC